MKNGLCTELTIAHKVEAFQMITTKDKMIESYSSLLFNLYLDYHVSFQNANLHSDTEQSLCCLQFYHSHVQCVNVIERGIMLVPPKWKKLHHCIRYSNLS